VSVTPAVELKLAGGETLTEFGNQPSGPQLEDKSWELFFWPAIQSHCFILKLGTKLTDPFSKASQIENLTTSLRITSQIESVNFNV
jgi:hypothetical protein